MGSIVREYTIAGNDKGTGVAGCATCAAQTYRGPTQPIANGSVHVTHPTTRSDRKLCAQSHWHSAMPRSSFVQEVQTMDEGAQSPVIQLPFCPLPVAQLRYMRTSASSPALCPQLENDRK